MKQSQINRAYVAAHTFFTTNGWAIRPQFRWDVTDCGLGEFDARGLVLITLTEEPEYCEKLMYAAQNQQTPAHYHLKKKEDIICRTGVLAIRLWPSVPETDPAVAFGLNRNGVWQAVDPTEPLRLQAGERVTIVPGIWHEFWPESEECIIGEVSTANDDVNDNVFHDERIGRYPTVEADEIPLIRLVSDAPAAHNELLSPA